MLDKASEHALVKINFIERYKNLSKQYHFDANESFENYETDIVVNIIQHLGYYCTFNKKEEFYKIIETIGDSKYQFKISLKYGAAEFLWSVWKCSELKIGGTWAILKEQLDGLEKDKVRRPIFRDYEDLKEILANAFAIYEDFKREY